MSDKEKKGKRKLEDTDYTALSALLDFHSDRATAHASFLVACVFGLFAILSLIGAPNQAPHPIYSIAYWLLWLGGLYSLLNFGYYAKKASRVRGRILKEKEALMKEIETKEPLLLRIFSTLKDSKPIKKCKIVVMIMLYFLFIGLFPWLSATGRLHWFNICVSLNNIALSQSLIILGLISEGIAAIITLRKPLSGYYKRLEKLPFQEQIRKERVEASIVLFFIILGMILQGAAVL